MPVEVGVLGEFEPADLALHISVQGMFDPLLAVPVRVGVAIPGLFRLECAFALRTFEQFLL